MYRKYFLILVCLFITSNILFGQVAQEKSYKFSGIVLDKDSLKPIKNATIQINQEKFIISKENGQFSFSANPKDTVIIYQEGLKNIGLIIPDTLITIKNLLGIFMAKDSINAKNVIIYPKIDEKDLRAIMLNGKPKDQETVNAENNAKSISYQAKAKNNVEQDATSMQKTMLRKYDSKVEYKYMISPDNMIMFSKIVPYIKKTIKEAQTEKTSVEMTKKDENLLKELFLRSHPKNNEIH
jgi:hypothetical protein